MKQLEIQSKKKKNLNLNLRSLLKIDSRYKRKTIKLIEKITFRNLLKQGRSRQRVIKLDTKARSIKGKGMMPDFIEKFFRFAS